MNSAHSMKRNCWAEALVKIARMILTIKLDWNWSSFQLANIALPQNVMRCDIAPSARISLIGTFRKDLWSS